jgi:NAD(P)-dependent dehydrogenase (short-subunit alcohol dehydrogenase family)
MSHQVSPKRAFVSGGGSGIGLAIAKMLADSGYHVDIGGRSRTRLEASGLSFVKMDVTDPASVAGAISQSGPFDIFVANAGAAETAPALKTNPAMWDRMIAVNLTSVFTCAQAAIPHMKQQGWGRFITVASTAGLKGYRYTAGYTAAKHGVIGLTRCLALELAETGVTVNAVCPGYTDTPLIDDALDNIRAKTAADRSTALAGLVKNNPMKRLVHASEVASTVLWLASDGAASVNGQAIAIDGGETAS